LQKILILPKKYIVKININFSYNQSETYVKNRTKIIITKNRIIFKNKKFVEVNKIKKIKKIK
jgi:hypothetical protein